MGLKVFCDPFFPVAVHERPDTTMNFIFLGRVFQAFVQKGLKKSHSKIFEKGSTAPIQTGDDHLTFRQSVRLLGPGMVRRKAGI